VVDLGGGTGATAAVLLETLPPGAMIISVDAAGAMQAAGQRVLPDPGSAGSPREPKTRPSIHADTWDHMV
jgi:trans-aconitate methyltransferase